jgi:hypothetical protein
MAVALLDEDRLFPAEPALRDVALEVNDEGSRRGFRWSAKR